jgi:5-methyltetrahydrofolate--homocysteine methyltransferase
MAYPNAGLPNELGQYDELPEGDRALIREWTDAGLVNVVGGCCGTSPAHIAAIAKAVADARRGRCRSAPQIDAADGLEPFVMGACSFQAPRATVTPVAKAGPSHP